MFDFWSEGPEGVLARAALTFVAVALMLAGHAP
jgi:hypothetical protein